MSISLIRILQILFLMQFELVIFGFEMNNIFKSLKNISTGVIKDINNYIPSPQAIFDLNKQMLMGYPFVVVSSAINKICTSALTSETIKPKIEPNICEMQFQLRKNCYQYNFPILRANEMWLSPHLDINKKIVIFSTGWTTRADEKNDAIDKFAEAYNCRGDVNFIALDVSNYIDTLFTWSAYNTETLGMNVAKGLQELIKLVPVQNIHLIGHSLGAHIMGTAGRYFQYFTNQTIPRITGLDPAKPCFKEGQSLSGLLRGDADFIDVIHSNPGVLGQRNSMGDIDFYPGGLDPLPPGCTSLTCAHSRAWEYYLETIYPNHEMDYIGYRCTSLTLLRQGKCYFVSAIMGYNVSKKKGNYFLEINNSSPHGKNANTTEFNSKCNTCSFYKRGRVF